MIKKDTGKLPGLIKGEDIVLQSDYMLLTSYLIDKNMIVFTIYRREGVRDKTWTLQEDFVVDADEYEAITKKMAFLNMKYGGEIC